MSTKKKKNVLSVTEQKPENVEQPKPEPQAPVPEAAVQKQEVPVEAAAEKPVVVSAPLKNILTRINSLTPDELVLLDRFKLPLKDMADWMFMMEQTLRQVPTVTEKGIAEELKKSLMADAQKQPQASAGNVARGEGIMGYLQVAKEMGLLGSGSSNPLMDKYVEALITRNMNEMVESTTFDKIMREYFIKKMSKELGEPLLSASPAKP